MINRGAARLARTTLLVMVAACLSLVACSSRGQEEPELLVFAASSLSDAFTEIGAAFEESGGGRVVLNFASSSTLATQILEGAPAAVFASANEAQMRRIVDARVASSSRTFATNSLVVVVPATGSPVESFEDLAVPGVKLVLAASEVPVGAYARQFIAAFDESVAGYEDTVLSNVVSEESNVRAVLTKVQLDEADAGVVYETDAAIAGGDVRTLAIPAEFNVVASYPITGIPVQGGPSSGDFVEFVLGDEGQSILQSYGFGPPPGQ